MRYDHDRINQGEVLHPRAVPRNESRGTMEGGKDNRGEMAKLEGAELKVNRMEFWGDPKGGLEPKRLK